MITIEGTNKIKGALDLGGINKQMKAGDILPLTNEDFSDQTVQMALSMGYITYDQNGGLDFSSNSSSIKLRNIYDRPLRINALDDEVRPNQTFTLTENQVNSSEIRGALAKGFLEIISSAQIVTNINESDVKIGEISFEPDEIKEEKSNVETNYNNLETNEEIKESGVIAAEKVITTEDPKPVEKSDISDPKGKTVIWNPTNAPVIHSKTQMDSISIDTEGNPSIIESDVDISDDINFVDKELDQKRKKNHPILKDKPENTDDGIDFL